MLRVIHCARSSIGDVGARDPHGYSVSGFVRTAELLTRDGLKAYDGAACRDIPILSGITADGTHLYPSQDDEHGNICGRAQKYTSPSYVVPKPIPAGAVVVAANAGSDYLFVPDGNINTVKAAVASLQSRLQFGAIFVSDRHGQIAGTLPMSLIKTETSGNGRAPDIIVSFSFDENVSVAGKSGVSYASSVNRRGDHGSFSPTDTHISLMASGPDFKSGLHDPLPTANVDIAPTVARILKFDMPAVQGRVLEEALQGGPPRRNTRCEQDAPVDDEDRIDRETADRPRRPGGRSHPYDLYGRAKDQDSHPRRNELHLLRSGHSRPRMNSRCVVRFIIQQNLALTMRAARIWLRHFALCDVFHT